MSVIFGEVIGDVCPKCKTCLNIEGEFSEGEEIECECGALLAIGEIEATYTLYMDVISDPDEDGEE